MEVGESERIFLKPGERQRSLVSTNLRLERNDGVEGAGSAIFYNTKINAPMEKQQRSLPVFKYKESILYLLERYQTLVVMGETGSGKTTQIPQYLHAAGWSSKGYVIGVTQPRRVAALSVAQRVADEMNTTLGGVVGYAMRFDEKFSLEHSRIKFMTDGHLIREMMYDPLLSKYSVLVVDEVHERTVNTDVILGLLKKVLRKRPEMRLIVSSATMDSERIAEFFDLSRESQKLRSSGSKTPTSYVLAIEGRMYPVDVHYLKVPTPDYVQSSVDVCLKIHREKRPGDILVFLTGQDQIQQAVETTNQMSDTKSQTNETLLVLSMHSSLAVQDQLRVFQPAPPGKRKVIFSTNIAEASITIPNVVYVVDCGMCKMTFYDAEHKLNKLVTTPISKNSANQRSGRAGRVRPGSVYRLYSEEQFSKLNQSTVPEMQRCDMAPVILLLKALGIDKILTFGFVSAPSARLMAVGLQLLYALDRLVIDKKCQLTQEVGIKVAEFPLSPTISKMLLVSGQFGCSEEMVTIAAMLQLESIYYVPPNRKREAERSRMRFAVKEGDHLTYVNIYRSFIEKRKDQGWCRRNHINFKALTHAAHIRSSLVQLLHKHGIPLVSCGDNDVALRKCLTTGFFSCVAKYHPSGEYRSVGSEKPLHIHPLSVLCYDVPPTWVVYNQIISSTMDYMRDITVIDPTWLVELAPHYYNFGTLNQLTPCNRVLGAGNQREG